MGNTHHHPTAPVPPLPPQAPPPRALPCMPAQPSLETPKCAFPPTLGICRNFCENCISTPFCSNVRGMSMGNNKYHPKAPVPPFPPQAPPPRALFFQGRDLIPPLGKGGLVPIRTFRSKFTKQFRLNFSKNYKKISGMGPVSQFNTN